MYTMIFINRNGRISPSYNVTQRLVKGCTEWRNEGEACKEKRKLDAGEQHRDCLKDTCLNSPGRRTTEGLRLVEADSQLGYDTWFLD